MATSNTGMVATKAMEPTVPLRAIEAVPNAKMAHQTLLGATTASENVIDGLNGLAVTESIGKLGHILRFPR